MPQSLEQDTLSPTANQREIGKEEWTTFSFCFHPPPPTVATKYGAESPHQMRQQLSHTEDHTHTHTCSSTAFTYLFHVLPLSRPQPPSQPHTLIHTTPPTTTHTPQTHQTLGWRPSGFATENPHDRFRFLHHFLGLPFGDMSPTYICKL